MKAKSAALNIATIAVYTAMVIAAQVMLSAVPGVELVTVMIASFAAAFDRRMGALVAVAFSLLRCVLFGFWPTVIILYLTYYPLLALVFSFIGKIKNKTVQIVVAVIGAALMTVVFTFIDNLVTPLFYGYTAKLWKAYILASFPFMIPQMIFVALSVAALYMPLVLSFKRIKKSISL